MSNITAWLNAEPDQLYLRASRLGTELAVAMSLLNLRQEDRPSPVVAELLLQWKGLIAESPADQDKAMELVMAKAEMEVAA
jgi:hypothetical protein